MGDSDRLVVILAGVFWGSGGRSETQTRPPERWPEGPAQAAGRSRGPETLHRARVSWGSERSGGTNETGWCWRRSVRLRPGQEVSGMTRAVLRGGSRGLRAGAAPA